MKTAARRRWGTILLPALLVLACGGPGDTGEAPLPDTRVGLSPGSVFDSPSPEPVAENQAEPGVSPLAGRPHAEAPPLIPHRIDEYLPITRGENLCLDCHQVAEKVEGEPTPIPESHYVDMRNAPGSVRENPVSARYPCTACHVTRTGAAPLVGNRFEE